MPEREWISTADAASIYRVAAGTVRRWAHEDQRAERAWRRTGRTRNRRWHRDDVQAGYDRRRAASSVSP